MYRILFVMAFALVSMLWGGVASAEDVAGYPLGYCNGEWGPRSEYKSSEASSEISAAVYIPSSLAATVAGNMIKTVKVAVCSSRNVKDFRVWVRKSLDGTDLTGGLIEDGSLVQGWNYVQLDRELPVDDVREGFYIGYSYFQPAKSGAVSTLPVTHENAFWLRFGAEGEWRDLSGEATLCIEGLVFGDNIPRINAAVETVRPDPWFILSEGRFGASVTVRNLGVETIGSLGLEMDVGGGNVCASSVDCEIPYGEVRSYRVEFTPDAGNIPSGQCSARFTVVSVNGQEDADMDDNALEASFKVIEKAYRRKVLIEEFTSESCPNCPKAAGYLHDIRSDAAYADKVEIMAHHSGYGKDWLTTEADKAYEWFYNSDDGTFAPAIMVDRRPTPFSETAPVFCPTNREEICGLIDSHFEEPCFVSIQLDGKYDNDDKSLIHVNVTGNRLDDALLADKGRINVCVLEDDIEARRQSGSGEGYKHNFVLRAVNDVWGEAIPWSGNDFSYDFDFRLDSKWVEGNIRIIAYVSDYDGTDPMDCQVYNTDGFNLMESGVDTAAVDSATPKIVRVFNSAGIECQYMSRGIYIVVYDDNTVARIIR